jgi:hypothetical protein
MGNSKFTSVKFLRAVTGHPCGKESWRQCRALRSAEGEVRKVDSVRMEERRDVKDFEFCLIMYDGILIKL